VPDTTAKIPWKFLSDNAVQSVEQDKFGVHSAYAKVLYHIAKTCSTPFSIALYSSWGTGKTSICNLIQKLAAADDHVYYVYLDVWKYSNEPLKRWILLETCKSLSEQHAISNYELGGRSLQSHLEFEESWEDRDKVTINFAAVRWLGVAVVALIGLFVAFLFLLPRESYVGHIFTVLSGFLAVGGVSALLFESVLKELFKSLSGLVFERKVKHVSAKPAFSSEKFGEIFQDMAHRATMPKDGVGNRIIFIFDNLDRCSEEVAVETIGVIKTYLDEPGCVYIIPCDEFALMKHITKSYTTDSAGDDGRKYAKEFLNKFFQTTLRLPIAREFDIETFLDEQLRLAEMTDLPADARDVLVLGYLGQTPRQIKRVLNDLIAYRSLAVEAEHENLVEAGALTSDLSLLTKMSVISVEWPGLLNMLGDDPELWADLMDKISTGQRIETKGIGPDLTSFLHATRHVSSDADLRPFIYLKRVKYERNVALAKSVQDNLRKGEAKEFLELLTAAKSPTEQEEIIRIATDLVRPWLEAPRDVFVKNSVSVLLKAADTVPGNRLLELIVSDLLRHVSASTKPVDLAEVISLPDIFKFSPTIQTGQKERCLERLADLFEPSVTFGKNHPQYWKQFLDHDDQLTSEMRSKLRGYIEARYSSNEGEAVQLLFEASQRKTDTSWTIQPSVLAAIAAKLTFAGDELDRQRTDVMTKFQSQMADTARNSVSAAIVTAVQGSRTRTLDAQAKTAIAFLNRLTSATLGQANLNTIATTLIEQVTAQASYPLKAAWLAPLIIMHKGLPASVQTAVDNLYRPYLLDPTEPAALVQLLTGMTANVCARLLGITGNVQVIHDEAARLETRFGAEPATANREQILNCFPSNWILANPGLFDESRSWDLSLFAKIVARGKRDKISDENLRKHLLTFIEQFLKSKGAVHSAVLDSLLSVSKEIPELLDEQVARALSECFIEVLGSNVEKNFADLRFLSTKLSAENRLWLAKELVNTVLKPRQPQWIQVLQRMAEDLGADPTLSADKGLVEDLDDYAFEAARVSPSEATSILVTLLPHLSQTVRQQNLDEAQDRLLGLEGSGSPVGQMQPYLALLKACSSDFKTSLPPKFATFCHRMLGTAKTDEEKNSVLEFLRDSQLARIDTSIADRIAELASSEGPVGETARLMLNPETAPGQSEERSDKE
jgi:hypothetical protein